MIFLFIYFNFKLIDYIYNFQLKHGYAHAVFESALSRLWPKVRKMATVQETIQWL